MSVIWVPVIRNATTQWALLNAFVLLDLQLTMKIIEDVVSNII